MADSRAIDDEGRCQKIKASGQRCRAFAMEGSPNCFYHSPEAKEARRAAQSRGGQGNQRQVLPVDSEDVRLDSARDVAELLAKTINQTRKGQISTKVATAIGYLAAPLMRAFEASSTEARLSRLEQALSARPAAGLFDPDAP